ncbi:hypothetical protein ACFFJ7_19170 [Pseudochelatococcus lubricantis]|uniref:hypothetical protein n=1 Tax=Pseudochelatococcus lubricantis TaxID=1538102 RepID=UPI0035E77044
MNDIPTPDTISLPTMVSAIDSALASVAPVQRDTKAAALRACAERIQELRAGGATWSQIGDALRAGGVSVSDDHIRRVIEKLKQGPSSNNHATQNKGAVLTSTYDKAKQKIANSTTSHMKRFASHDE